MNITPLFNKLKKEYGLNNIKLFYSNKLKSALARAYLNENRIIMRRLPARMDEIEKIIKHELIHFKLHREKKGYDDKDKDFVEECIRGGTFHKLNEDFLKFFKYYEFYCPFCKNVKYSWYDLKNPKCKKCGMKTKHLNISYSV